jgi:pimeloyl-ACP methyl ester carboxylesterase
MYVRYEKPLYDQETKGLAIIQHGYSSSMDAPHIKAMARTFQENGLATLSLDATHSFNPGDGDLEGNTIETHLHDLYDAIEWAKQQEWFISPFALAGHSLGGYTVLHYAEEHPEDISLLFPCSAVTSGEKLAEAFERGMPEGVFESWRDKGYMEIESWDGSGKTGKRPFSWLTGMKDCSVLENAHKLTMPVLLVVGSEDIPTPYDHHLELYNLLPGEDREMHIIPGSDHPFTDPQHRHKMAEILDSWLKSKLSDYISSNK